MKSFFSPSFFFLYHYFISTFSYLQPLFLISSLYFNYSNFVSSIVCRIYSILVRYIRLRGESLVEENTVHALKKVQQVSDELFQFARLCFTSTIRCSILCPVLHPLFPPYQRVINFLNFVSLPKFSLLMRFQFSLRYYT